jgi:hypothetical protein
MKLTRRNLSLFAVLLLAVVAALAEAGPNPEAKPKPRPRPRPKAKAQQQGAGAGGAGAAGGDDNYDYDNYEYEDYYNQLNGQGGKQPGKPGAGAGGRRPAPVAPPPEPEMDPEDLEPSRGDTAPGMLTIHCHLIAQKSQQLFFASDIEFFYSFLVTQTALKRPYHIEDNHL